MQNLLKTSLTQENEAILVLKDIKKVNGMEVKSEFWEEGAQGILGFTPKPLRINISCQPLAESEMYVFVRIYIH